MNLRCAKNLSFAINKRRSISSFNFKIIYIITYKNLKLLITLTVLYPTNLYLPPNLFANYTNKILNYLYILEKSVGLGDSKESLFAPMKWK